MASLNQNYLIFLQEEAMLRDGQSGMDNCSSAPGNFKMNRENKAGEGEYLTPMQGVGFGATTSP